ncbi:major outer membrane protein [Campylobacter gastrosuis]|uniref:Major outer membrane protein n=1 Tax=Campylobacter gastrosuis TaxID=2974576 RepID=A0ABT7HP79_9BACT|nr:major outer membrane protein [Campylobacter gastrosuis]MDL0088615.1 major outer membrane protein [Campylobacter gastrosuis]
MKLTKVSLAALVALGAFSSVASATPLEEAIKDVDVSGFARYRYDYSTNKYTEGNPSTTTKHHKSNREDADEGTGTNHKFKIVTNFKATIDDNFYAVLGLRYNAGDNTAARQGTNGVGGYDNTNVNSTFGVYQAYVGYKVGNTEITAGKQVLGTYFTDDEVGTAFKVVNTDITGLALAAIAVDAFENSGETDGALIPFAGDKNYKTGNLYGVAAIGSYDPIGFQLWYATLENVVDLLAVELSADVKVTDDIGINGKFQFVNSDADSKLKETVATYNDGKFYAAELGTELFGADLSAGYVGWKAKERNGATGTTSFTYEDQGSLISPAEQFSDYFDYTFVNGKGNFWFITAGYTLDKFRLGVDYVQGSVKLAGNNGKEKYKEVVPSVSYAYSKKLKFSTYYSAAELKNNAQQDKEKSQRYRFEARYSF